MFLVLDEENQMCLKLTFNYWAQVSEHSTASILMVKFKLDIIEFWEKFPGTPFIFRDGFPYSKHEFVNIDICLEVVISALYKAQQQLIEHCSYHDC